MLRKHNRNHSGQSNQSGTVIETRAQTAILMPMSSDVQEIEQAIRTLPRREIEQLRE